MSNPDTGQHMQMKEKEDYGSKRMGLKMVVGDMMMTQKILVIGNTQMKLKVATGSLQRMTQWYSMLLLNLSDDSTQLTMNLDTGQQMQMTILVIGLQKMALTTVHGFMNQAQRQLVPG
jgi:hypothetical protein